MLSRRVLGLVTLFTVSVGVAFGRTSGQQPSSLPNPDAIKIEIKRGERRESEPKPFVVGDLFTFHLLMTNTSNEPLPLTVMSKVLLQERPELRREGRTLPYRVGVSARLQTSADFELLQPVRPGLLPHQSGQISSFALDEWFEPLLSGRYQLIIRHRFKPDQSWIEASITFDVLPADAGLSKTPFTSDSLGAIDDEVVRAVLKKKPACRHERTRPMLGSENIVIDSWICGRERVGSHVFEMTSPEEATRSLQKRYGEANERLRGLGDEGLVISGNTVIFRKGRLLIDVVSGVNSPRAEFGQQVKLNKQFAQYIAAALPTSGLYTTVNLTPAPLATAAQLQIALAPADYMPAGDGPPDRVSKPFRVGDMKVVFGLVMTNVSSAPLKVQTYFNQQQNRPELFREGQLVSYLDKAPKSTTADQVLIDYGKVIIALLQPHQPQILETINLSEWYGALQPGHYRLNNKHRLDLWRNEWIDCGSITFDVWSTQK